MGTEQEGSAKRRDSYTVGWIAPLSFEQTAALSMFDETHQRPPDFEQGETDKNSYRWGCIGNHDVVVASLPEGAYGTTPAAVAANSLLCSFPNIRFGLLVGIGGGVPRPENDIRLGDIVVGRPEGSFGGVIQYDLVKVKSGGKEQRSFLNSPPLVLLNALTSLKADHLMKDSKVPKFLKEAIQCYPKMKKTFVHQGVENDQLFDSSSSQSAPGSSSKETVVQREARDSIEPEIHYGLIASGNTLFKDSSARDQILHEVTDKYICVEMEAAGLMNNFPCLVIRGISDYADSRKNDRWQHYAALTAAAFTKELLEYVHNKDIMETSTALETLQLEVKEVKEKLNETHDVTLQTKFILDAQNLNQHEKHVKVWLDPPSTSNNLEEARKRRSDGTCSWLFNREEFKEWIDGSRKLLWLYGKPGCGKTVLSAAIVDHLVHSKLSNSDPSLLLDFFFDFKDHKKQTFDRFLCALLFRLYCICEESRHEVDGLFKKCDEGKKQPSHVDLLETLRKILTAGEFRGPVRIVVDALDECEPMNTERKELLEWIRDTVSGPTNATILVTSRPERDIEEAISSLPGDKHGIPIEPNLIASDISTYIRNTIRSKTNGFKRWDKPEFDYLLDEIEDRLKEKADGMFRWAACQLVELESCLTPPAVRETIKNLPITLSETYSRILVKIEASNHKGDAIRLLQLLTFSTQPLTLKGFVDAAAVDLGTERFDPKNKAPQPHEIASVCSSLVTLQRATSENSDGITLELAHLSVKEYLLSHDLKESFRDDMEEKTARSAIVTISLIYLESINWRNSAKQTREEFPFADFSARYWSRHAREVRSEVQLQERLSIFFSDKSEAYNLSTRIFDPDTGSRNEPEPYKRRTPLYYASLAGLADTVTYLLEKKVDVNAPCGLYGNALQAAIVRGNIDVVRPLLRRGAEVNAPGGRYGYPLQAAVVKGDLAIVNLLLDQGAKINARGGRLGSALCAASYLENLKAVQLLCDKGANLDAIVYDCGTALETVSSLGNLKMVQALLDAGAGVNVRGRKNGTALIAASRKGHLEIVRALLSTNDIDIYAQSEGIGDALEIASAHGYLDIVRILLDRGADVNCHRADGSPLIAASMRGHAEVVRLLCKKGAFVDARVKSWNTALQAASQNGHLEIVSILLEEGAEVDVQGGEYQSPIQAASENGHIDVVRALLDKGANANPHFTEDKGSILQLALMKGHYDIAIILLDKGTDFKAGSREHANPLSLASKIGYGHIVSILLSGGVDVNMQWGNQDSALTAASYHGHRDIVRLLLDKGADWNTESYMFGNALQAALAGGRLDIARTLMEAGAKLDSQGKQYSSALTFASIAGHLETVHMLLNQFSHVLIQPERLDYALILASEHGHLDMVCLLLDAGANVNFHLGNGGDALYAASEGGNIDVVRKLLEKGANIYAQGARYNTALQIASLKEHFDIVQLLLDNNADINAEGGIATSALLAALSIGNADIALMLLERGANVNAVHKYRGSALKIALEARLHDVVYILMTKVADVHNDALQAAASTGSLDIVRFLLDKGVDADDPGRKYSKALKSAAKKGRLDIVHMLLKRGAVVDPQSLNAASAGGHLEIVRLFLGVITELNAAEPKPLFDEALQRASEHGQPDAVRLLLEKSADANIKIQEELYKSLINASRNGHYDLVRILCEAGADINAKDENHQKNALLAASNGNHTDVVRLLLEKGADIDASYDEKDGNALHAAARECNLENIKLLLDRGAGIDAQSKCHGSALQVALHCHDNVDVARLLLDRGADINAQGGYYGNALQAASYYGNHDVVRFLLDRRADINAQGGKYGSALQAAVVRNHLHIVLLLLKMGADVNLPGGEHGNALQAASYHGCLDVVRVLLDRGAEVNAQDGKYGSAIQAALVDHKLDYLDMSGDRKCCGGKSPDTKYTFNALRNSSTKDRCSLDIIKLLLERNAEVNAQGGEYGSALQAASYHGHLKAVHLLLEKGANVNAEGGRFGNALQAAKVKGNIEIVELLEKRIHLIEVASRKRINRTDPEDEECIEELGMKELRRSPRNKKRKKT